MEFKLYLNKVLYGEYLTRLEAHQALSLICTDLSIHQEQISAFLAVLHSRRESRDEILGFLDYLVQNIIQVKMLANDTLDICGTGGDGHNTFNISTASAILLASGGVKVCKHGAGAISSKSGSFEVLKHLNIPIFQHPELCSQMLHEMGFVFLFAPYFNPAYQKLKTLRRRIGIRTVFNLLGPLLNPARVNRQIIGVYDKNLLPLFADVLAKMDLQEAMVVHAEEGLDEFSLNGKTFYAYVKNKAVTFGEFDPQAFALPKVDVNLMKGGEPKENAFIIEEIFAGSEAEKRDVVLLNASFGFIMAGICKSFEEAYEYGLKLIKNKITLNYLKTLQNYT